MNRKLLSLRISGLLAVSLGFACSAAPDSSDVSGGAVTGGSGPIDLGERPAPKGCGDGVLTEDEACDDGNLAGGDGCMANCLGIDSGFICPVPGELCIAYAKCGDGIVSFPEQCDDGGEEPKDGCSSTCKIELGFKCSSAQPNEQSSCSPTVCGDGVIEGAETCDNGPDVVGDGCSPQCIGEPDCSAGACTSSCGDGLVLGEACDDGNLIDGDGCSSKCVIEAGYECSQETDCSKDENGKCALTIPVVYRDFSKDHPDFEEGNACAANGPTKGMVENKLVNGKPVPVPVGGKLDCRHIGEWYEDSVKSTTFVDSIVLYDNGSGGYVNRWGPDGEQWIQYSNFQWVSEVYEQCEASGCIRCDYAPEKGCSATATPKDGDPLFFPVDGIEGAKDDGGFYAEVSNRYWTQYTLEGKIFPGAPKHNFHFTTEVTYWFGYDETTDATLDFTGDDDLWVFVNGTLAVDVGGVHEAENGSVSINAGTAGTFGLTPGNVYEIKIFHAERQTTASSFRLTLDGFTTARSDCKPVCGDGIIGVGEQCDDGVNDGGYNQCQAGCVLGAYCGNGIVDEGESCDDADPAKPGDCAGCRRVVIK